MNFKALILSVGPDHREHSWVVKVVGDEPGKIIGNKITQDFVSLPTMIQLYEE